MHVLFHLTATSSISVHDGIIFVDFPRLKNCACGGRYYIRRKQSKDVRHSVLHNQTLFIHITVITYRCKNCKHYVTNDGGLGVQHQTTAHYRQLAIQMVTAASLGQVARILQVPKSTIAGWHKKARLLTQATH